MSSWLAEMSSQRIASVIAWSVGLLLALVLGMVGAARLKRRLRQDDFQPAAASGFTLSDLRQMHRAGQLTDAEFERAKEKVLAAAQKAAARAAPPPGVTPEKDSVEAIRLRRLAREAQGNSGQDAAGDDVDDPPPPPPRA
jgi:hypothetical protein